MAVPPLLPSFLLPQTEQKMNETLFDISVDTLRPPDLSAFLSHPSSSSQHSQSGSQSPPTPPYAYASSSHSHSHSNSNSNSPPEQLVTTNPLPPPPLPNAQQQHRMKSCAPCRVRRVKCERLLQSGSTDCTQCMKKGIQCVEMPKKQKLSSGAARTGKRIDQAKALFGTKQYASTSSANASGDEAGGSNNFTSQTIVTNALASVAIFAPSNIDSSTTSSQNFSTLLQPNSIANRMDSKEMQSALVANLIDTYMDFAQARNLTVEQTGFRRDFERAGRRLDEMPSTSAVLTAVIIALSARVSDHPAFVGSAAPRIWELGKAGTEGRDLTEFGSKREAACHVLLEKAIDMVDRSGCLRIPSVDNVAALQLLEQLVEPSEHNLATSAGPFSYAYFGHVRELIIAGQIEDHGKRTYIAGSVYGWTAYIRDAYTSARIGRLPFFTDEDLELIRDGEPASPSVQEALMKPPNPMVIKGFWELFLPLLEHLAEWARKAAKELTGLFARRQPRANIAFLHSIMNAIDIANLAVPTLHDRGVAFSQMNFKFSRDALGTTRSLIVSTIALGFLVHRIIHQRLASKWKPQSEAGFVYEGRYEWPALPGPEEEDEEYWKELMGLRQRSFGVGFMSTRRLANLFEETLRAGIPVGSSQFIDGRSCQLLFSSISEWLPTFLESPTAEEGGLSDFTLDTKISELRWIHKAVCSVGWSYERLGKSEPWVRSEINKLEQKKQSQQQQVWSDLSSSFSANPNSTSTSFDPAVPLPVQPLTPPLPLPLDLDFSTLTSPNDPNPNSNPHLNTGMEGFEPGEILFSEEDLQALLGMGLENGGWPGQMAMQNGFASMSEAGQFDFLGFGTTTTIQGGGQQQTQQGQAEMF